MKRIFVCSPYSGNIEYHTDKARQYCAAIVKMGHLPIAPHLYFPQFMDEHSPDEREHGIRMGIELLDDCDELWIFGKVSPGMLQEITHALTSRTPVKIGSIETEKVREEE